ncbi:hypothetical protein EV356DRAFT_289411 [Viridothelium virens]|uniref:Uncharacterized protein n=1 Tax=Viridothelium virens TaxID=1048519 RepID=A0A6A6H113_VIRVR|nr:hypothetical protein EV356DRAFT_289411 [Viridothelium virens]
MFLAFCLNQERHLVYCKISGHCGIPVGLGFWAILCGTNYQHRRYSMATYLARSPKDDMLSHAPPMTSCLSRAVDMI